LHTTCSKYTPLITFFVEEYTANHSSVDGDELNALEKEIGEAIRANPKDLLPGTFRPGKNGNQNHGSDSRPQTSSANPQDLVSLLFLFPVLYLPSPF
jgi:hypothetical protein